MSDEIKSLLEKQGKAFEEFKAANDANEKKRDGVLEEKISKLSAELADISKQGKAAVDAAEAAQKAAQRPRAGDDRVTPEGLAHKSALFSYLRTGGGESELKAAERKAVEVKALSAGVATDGGYTVHSELDSAIDRVARSTITMRRLATLRPTAQKSYKKIVTTSGASVGGWGNEHTAPSETSGPSMAELEFTPGTIWAEPRATQELLEDSDQDIEAWLADEVGVTFEEQENSAFLSGTGVNKPKGLLAYTMVANASSTWGSVGYTVTGGASSFASSNPTDALISLVHSLKPKYRAGASFLMNDATLATIRKFKDGQSNYLLMPGQSIQQPFRETILGYGIESDDNMPDLGSNTYPVAFADFKRAYVIVDRRGTTIIRDALTAKPYVKFYTTRRVGGGIQNFEAVKVLKCST